MNKNLMVILTHGRADPAVSLFLPFWKRSGCDLLLASPKDDVSSIREPGLKFVHCGASYNKDDRATYWLYQARVLETMIMMLEEDYDGFVFTQYDSICLGPLPVIGPDDCVQHVFGNNDPAYKAKVYTHPPWCFGRNRLAQFVRAARIKAINLERGVMDRWMPLVMEEIGMTVTPSNPWSWSANSIDSPGAVQECRERIKQGALFVHGVKDRTQLEAILK